MAPADHFSAQGITYQQGYNVADYLLDVASDPPVTLFPSTANGVGKESTIADGSANVLEKGYGSPTPQSAMPAATTARSTSRCATTFLTQLEGLSGREWKILRR